MKVFGNKSSELFPTHLRKYVVHIQMKTRRILSGILTGDFITRQRGGGFEFDQIREYELGDDVRAIDWKSSARLGRILTKQYLDDKNRTVWLCVDISESMFTSKDGGEKYQKAALAASVFALIAEYNKDLVGVIFFDQEIVGCVPPGKGMGHTTHVMHSLFSVCGRGKATSFAAVAKYINTYIKKRSCVIIISDFIAPLDRGLLSQLTMRHQVMMGRCLVPMEYSMPVAGLLPVVDPETGTQGIVNLGALQKKGVLQQRIARQDTLLRQYKVGVFAIADRETVVTDIVTFFRKQEFV